MNSYEFLRRQGRYEGRTVKWKRWSCTNRLRKKEWESYLHPLTYKFDPNHARIWWSQRVLLRWGSPGLLPILTANEEAGMTCGGIAGTKEKVGKERRKRQKRLIISRSTGELGDYDRSFLLFDPYKTIWHTACMCVNAKNIANDGRKRGRKHSTEAQQASSIAVDSGRSRLTLVYHK